LHGIKTANPNIVCIVFLQSPIRQQVYNLHIDWFTGIHATPSRTHSQKVAQLLQFLQTRRAASLTNSVTFGALDIGLHLCVFG